MLCDLQEISKKFQMIGTFIAAFLGAAVAIETSKERPVKEQKQLPLSFYQEWARDLGKYYDEHPEKRKEPIDYDDYF